MAVYRITFSLAVIISFFHKYEKLIYLDLIQLFIVSCCIIRLKINHITGFPYFACFDSYRSEIQQGSSRIYSERMVGHQVPRHYRHYGCCFLYSQRYLHSIRYDLLQPNTFIAPIIQEDWLSFSNAILNIAITAISDVRSELTNGDLMFSLDFAFWCRDLHFDSTHFVGRYGARLG